MKKRETIFAADLFCGGGGSSTGLVAACRELGKKIDLVAINHWHKAVDVHAANYPFARHLCMDVQFADPRVVVPGGYLDILVGSPSCFAEGTLVLTESGLISIEEVKVGDKVLTHKGRWRKVTSTMASVKETVILQGQGHYGIEVTADHPFLARKCSKKDTFRRKPTRYHHAFREFSAPEWIEAKDLVRTGAHWATPKNISALPIPVVGGRGMEFKDNFWWLVGFWLAEGWISIRAGHTPEICLACSNEEADQIESQLRIFLPVHDGPRALMSELRWRRMATPTGVNFTTTHTGLAAWLIEHFGRFSFGKTIPAWALGMREEWKRSLVAGYLQGDGSKTRFKEGICDASTVSKSLAVGIRLLAESMGYSTSLYLAKKQKTHIIDGRLINQRPQYKVLWHDRRAEKHEPGFRDESFDWLACKKILPGRKQVLVYNISVEEDESYLADGLVVHNCIYFSRAAGGRPKNDQQRASIWDILRWLEYLDVKSLLIENVPEIAGYGPLDAKGFPIKERRGETYRAFLEAVRSYGYNVEDRVVNSADYGAATSRSRLFIVAKKGPRSRITWPEPTHSKRAGTGRKKWRPAKEIIDWSIKGESIFNRKRPLSPNTLRRIITGLKKFGGKEIQPFLVLMEHGGRLKGIDAPLPTITTAKGGSMALVQPYVLSQASGGAPRSTDDPLPTITTDGAHGLVRPFLTLSEFSKRNGPAIRTIEEPLPTITSAASMGLVEPFVLGQCTNNAPRSTHEPLPTILGAGKHALVEPFIVQYHGSQRGTDTGDRRVSSIDEPLATLDTSNRYAIAEPFLLPNEGFFQDEGRSHNPPRSIEEPLSTVTQRGGGHLVESCLIQYNGKSEAQSIDEPLPTVPTRDRFGLVQPVINGRTVEILFRMLQPHELAAAMGFPKGYFSNAPATVNKGDVIKMVGNAVQTQVAKALCLSLLSSNGKTGSGTPAPVRARKHSLENGGRAG